MGILEQAQNLLLRAQVVPQSVMDSYQKFVEASAKAQSDFETRQQEYEKRQLEYEKRQAEEASRRKELEASHKTVEANLNALIQIMDELIRNRPPQKPN